MKGRTDFQAGYDYAINNKVFTHFSIDELYDFTQVYVEQYLGTGEKHVLGIASALVDIIEGRKVSAA